MKALICFLSLFAFNALAAGEWKGDFTIANLVMEGTDNQPLANISLSPNPQTSCSDNTFVSMPTSSEMGKQALSVFMLAAASNKKVKVFIDGCLGARPQVRHVWVINQ